MQDQAPKSFSITGTALEAFYALKKLATEAPVLKLASWDEPFKVVTDASNIAIGAVLQQQERPVAYYSKKLDSAQRNYSVYDKELLAVISALKHWKHFLYGREFVVKTDHQALKWLQTMPSANWSDRQARWSQVFQQFGGMIEYLPGKHNPVADALSRKSGSSQAVQPITVIELNGVELDNMKEEYPDSAEFGTSYSLALAGEPGHYSIQDGWLLYKGRLCLTSSYRAAALHDAHDSLVGGHRGINSTLEKLERQFHWPRMRRDVYEYVQRCQTCQKVKSSHQKTPGLLQPLPIPDGPFQDISMDFVGPLPASHPSRNTMCFTIVDRFSKYVMLIPCKHTITAEDVARLFIRFWYPVAGLPKTITSDRDAKFTSQFWKALFSNFGTRLQFSSAFHPQTDGQTEIYNQLAFDVLKAYCNDQQNRWESHLPLVQAILNDTHSSSIGRTPYEAAFGKRFSSLLTRSVSPSLEANRTVESYSEIMESVKERIAKAQEAYTRQANKSRRAVHYKEGDWVYLRIMKQRLKQVGKRCPKLSFRSFGPFPIMKVINEVSMQLRLPQSWTMHNVFHVSWLKPYVGPALTDIAEEQQPEVLDEAEVIEPEQILLHRWKHGSGRRKRQFFTKFRERGTHEAVWLDQEFFLEYPQILADYLDAMQLPPI